MKPETVRPRRSAWTLLGGAVAVGAAAMMFLSWGASSAAAAEGSSRVEERIVEMHHHLKITSAQEDQWRAVAQVMRESEFAIRPLVEERHKRAETMTAIDDLNTYAAIAEAHASGVKKFAVAFEPLYAAMSESQKKEADELFRKGPPGMSKAK